MYDNSFNLGAWRRERLGVAKATEAYKGLAPIQRQLVDHIVRKYEHPIDGAFPSHATLARRFGLSRRSVIRHLKAIVQTGVLTSERRRNGAGTDGRPLSNRYRLSEAIVTYPVT